MRFNSLWLGRFWWNFKCVLFKPITMIDSEHIISEIALRRMSLDLTDDEPTLAQVMAWCRQATSHYLSQCWPRSLSPYDVTRPQSVKAVWVAWSFSLIRAKLCEIKYRELQHLTTRVSLFGCWYVLVKVVLPTSVMVMGFMIWGWPH